jgi:hypothetical protein
MDDFRRNVAKVFQKARSNWTYLGNWHDANA